MPYMVKEIAEIAGISVRTLHYYDQIGLLKPASINMAGYRIYSDDDLERLQQILFFKELDFSLTEIKDILARPGYNRKEALKAHRELLIKKRERLTKIIKSVEKTIDSLEGGKAMTKREMFAGFDMSEIERHIEKYADEVKEKYGHTEAYRESMEKTSRYKKEDWNRIMKNSADIYIKLAALLEQDPADPAVQKLIEDYRQFITDNFYHCTREIFRGLGELYVNDRRFTKNIDQYKPGLAKFMSEAIKIYCEQQED